jgi:predicted AlkP superfamily phosphohydrolase/phosphomutase
LDLMAGASGRTIVVGLELGDASLVQAWGRAGHMPAIRKLMERGSWGMLESTADRLHISAWPSLYTGATAGEHGVYFTFQPAPGLQGHQRFHPGLYGRPTFWRVLDDAGRKCAVLDPPYTHPEQGYKSAFVHDWGCWARYLKTGSTPDSLLSRLRQHCGSYPLGLEANDLGLAPLDAAALAPRLVESARAKAAAARWLCEDQGAEVFFTVFGETHAAGHYCWEEALVDADYRLERSPMLTVYQEIDRAIEGIAASAGPDGTVIVISGDSVAPNRAGWHLLPGILERLGFLAGPQSDPADGAKGRAAARSFDPVKAVRDLLPKDFRKNLARMLPTAVRDRLAKRVDAANIDWSRTRAYTLPTDLEGYVRINLRGREPAGIVEPGVEYAQVVAELVAELARLRDPRTGRAIVRDVLCVDDEFPGDRRGWLPDLVVRWDPSAPIDAATSERIGTLALPSPDPRPGTHAGPGFVLAAGPGIPAAGVLEGGHIFDFAPTLLARLGVAVPGHMGGRVWSEWTNTRNRARSLAS